MTVIIVGAGIAGVACASRLAAANIPVRIVDRGDRIGGRMASPLRCGRPVDVGAAYFTAAEPKFDDVVQNWRRRGFAREWTNELSVFTAGHRSQKKGPTRWAAVNGLGTLVEDLAMGLDVRLNTPVSLVGAGPSVNGESATAVVLAMPDPQALDILDVSLPGVRAALSPEGWSPIQVVAAGFAAREWSPLEGAFVNEHSILTRIFDDGSRRSDGAAVLVAHTTTESFGAPAETVVESMRQQLGIRSLPIWTDSWRWPQASPPRARPVRYHLGTEGVGIAGDAWGEPRIETAYLSGASLGDALAVRIRS